MQPYIIKRICALRLIIYSLLVMGVCSVWMPTYLHAKGSEDKQATALIENYVQAIGGREKLAHMQSIWKRAKVHVLFFRFHVWNYDTRVSDSAHLYRNLGGVRFLGKKMFATFEKDTLEHTYAFFGRKKKGVRYLLDYKHWKRRRKKGVEDPVRAAYKLYSAFYSLGEDSGRVLRWLAPMETDSLSYQGTETHKRKTYEVLYHRNNENPFVWTLYYFNPHTHLLAMEKEISMKARKRGRLRVRTETTHYLSYESTQGISYPTIAKRSRIFYVQTKDVKINLSEKEALAQYPYFPMMDSTVRARIPTLGQGPDPNRWDEYMSNP